MAIPRLPALAAAALFLSSLGIGGCTKAAQTARHTERADRYFETNDYAKAKIEYMNVLRTSGPSAKAIARLGEISCLQGDYLQAAPFLLRARELDADNLENRLRLTRVLVAVGSKADARKEAAAMLQQSPDHGEALLLLTESSVIADELANTEQVVADFPQKNSPYFHLARSQLALRRGDVSAAEKFAMEAVAADPKSALAHSSVGVIQSLRKDTEHARQSFKTAAELAPIRSNIRIAYAEFLAQNGAIEDAKNYLNGLTKQATDFVPAWQALARIALASKKFDQAEADFQRIFAQSHESPEALMLQAQAWLEQGDTQKAVTQLERLDQKYENAPAIKYQLARAYVQANNLEPATLALEQAVAAYPEHVDAILLLAQINLRKGNAQAAATAMQELLKKQPHLLQAEVLLAEIYRAAGRLDEAASVWRGHIEYSPNIPPTYVALGLVLREQKKTEEARAAFQKTLQLAPDDLNAVDQLVELDISEQKFKPALERAEREIQKAPQAPRAHFIAAKVYIAQKLWDQAERALKEAIQRDEKFQPAYNSLVGVYLAAGKLPEALKQIENTIARNPNDQGALSAAALIYTQLKDYAGAVRMYDKLLALNPNNYIALNNLAYLDSENLKQLDKAYELATKARSVAPSIGLIAGTLGWIDYKRGDFQQAAALLQESAAALPNNAEVQFHLGMANYMMGQEETARAALQRSLDAGTDFPGKEEAQRRLALLARSNAGQKWLSTAELETMLKDQPKDLVVLERLGQEWEKQKDFAKAAAAYEQAFNLNPKIVRIPLILAQLYAGPLKNQSKALDFAKKAREMAPNDAAVGGALGRIALETNNYAWAYSLLQDSTRKGGTDAVVQHDLAIAAYACGKVSEARDAMQQSMRLRTEGVEFEDARRFVALTADVSPSESVRLESEAREVLTREPEYVPALMVSADIHLERKEADAARELYTKVLAKYPDFAPAQKRLASIYAQHADSVDKAYELATRARKTLPDDAELGGLLGELDYKRNDFRSAIQVLQQSARKRPLSPPQLFYLGMAQVKTNQNVQGREALQRALAQGLDETLAPQAKEALSPKPR